MAPKFIIDINMPETSAEDQMVACQRFLEERLEDFSATALTVEPVEGEDNVGVDTRAKKEAQEKAPPPPAAQQKAPRSITELHVLVLRTKEGQEGIATLKGQPIVFSDRAKFDMANKVFKSNLMVDPAPAGMKFFHTVFGPIQGMGEVK